MTLSRQFFVCGDNNPASPSPHLARARPLGPGHHRQDEGVVPRNLMIGRAFFVYFPSMIKAPSPAAGAGLRPPALDLVTIAQPTSPHALRAVVPLRTVPLFRRDCIR